MKREKAFTLVVIAACLGMICFGMYSGTPMDEYIPKTPDEARIISLISSFHRARTDYDLEGFLACLDEKGSFMFSGTRMISKKELAQFLPGFWSDLKSGNMFPRPICRESLNGNFFDGSFYDPVIKVENQTARATLKFVTPIIRWKTLLFLDLKKQGGSWRISRFEWDMG